MKKISISQRLTHSLRKQVSSRICVNVRVQVMVAAIIFISKLERLILNRQMLSVAVKITE